MTQREFYNAIINGTITEDVINTAKAYLAKIDATNEKRRNTPSKAQEANAPLMDQIVATVLTGEAKTASDVATELGVSPQKASALLRALVAEGKANVQDVKVPKKGTQKGYTLAE
jgi:predicted HTH transcriptional regulator